MTDKFYKNTPCKSIINDEVIDKLRMNDAFDFHKSLNVYQSTPLIKLSELSKKYNVGNIFVKDESHRFGLKAFKVLGASYAINRLLAKDPSIETFCTATDGNHGRAVAWSAKTLCKKVIVFVPQDTTIKRIQAIEKEGAKVIQVKGNYDDACKQAKQMSKIYGYTLIQDTAWEDYKEIPSLIMAGYLTMFKELEENLKTEKVKQFDVIFLQAGVGSMAASGIYYFLNKYEKNKPKIVVVEPKEADGILESFRNNKISTSKGNSNTIMAGLNCETPSVIAWNLLKSGTDYSVKIDDAYTKQAMRELYFPEGSDEKIISGESGASGFAGFLTIVNEKDFLSVKESLQINNHSNILFFNTEGNTDEDVFEQIISPNFTKIT